MAVSIIYVKITDKTTVEECDSFKSYLSSFKEITSVPFNFYTDLYIGMICYIVLYFYPSKTLRLEYYNPIYRYKEHREYIKYNSIREFIEADILPSFIFDNRI